MKVRWVILLMIAAILTSVSAFGQSPVALKAETTVKVLPIVPTIDGYDTGVTCVNVTTNPLTISNFVFYSTDGSMATGVEAAKAEAANRKMQGLSFTIAPNGRFSMLAGVELIGMGLNGQLRFTLIGDGALKALCYEGIISPDFNTDIVEAKELTRQEKSPQN